MADSRSSTEDFFDRYGDALDDRVAEMVEEIVDARIAHRLRTHRGWLRAVALLCVLAAISVGVRHSSAALAGVWIAAAAGCLLWSRFRRDDVV